VFLQRSLFLAAGSAIFGGLIVYAVSLRSSAPPPVKSNVIDPPDRAGLAKDVQALRREVLQIRMRDMQRAPPDDGARAAVPAGSEHLTRNELRARVEQLQRNPSEVDDSEAARRQRQRLEELLAREHREPKWATETEQQVEGVVGAVKSGVALQEVKCTSTICKVVVKVDEAKRQELVMNVATKEPFSWGTQYSYDGPVATMYVARKGHDFPDEAE
jgi:hypothetical protein